jgi:hypothetical protein
MDKTDDLWTTLSEYQTLDKQVIPGDHTTQLSDGPDIAAFL